MLKPWSFPFSIFACRLKTYQVTETKLKKCHSFFSLFSVYNVIQFLISFLVVVITRKLNLKVKFLFWQYKCRANWLRGSLVSQTFKYNETKYNFFFYWGVLCQYLVYRKIWRLLFSWKRHVRKIWHEIAKS